MRMFPHTLFSDNICETDLAAPSKTGQIFNDIRISSPRSATNYAKCTDLFTLNVKYILQYFAISESVHSYTACCGTRVETPKS